MRSLKARIEKLERAAGNPSDLEDLTDEDLDKRLEEIDQSLIAMVAKRCRWLEELKDRKQAPLVQQLGREEVEFLTEIEGISRKESSDPHPESATQRELKRVLRQFIDKCTAKLKAWRLSVPWNLTEENRTTANGMED